MTAAHEVPLTATLATGVEMPMVGLGTWQLRGQTAYDSTRSALEAGYRHIDTATMYGNEAEVGRAIRDARLERPEVFVTTKLPPERAGRERETIAASLRALGTDYVDLWLVHWPPRRPRARARTWSEFLAIRDEGLARAVGVSNYSVEQIDELLNVSAEKPDVNQVPWNPFRHDPPLLAAHRERGTLLEGYSPFKRTRLDDPTLDAIASAHGVSPAQVVLRWHLQHGIPVIPRSTNAARIRANFDVFGFALSVEETGRIDALSSKA